MPERRLELAPDVELFPEDDKLTLTIPGPDRKLHTFTCKDRAGLKQLDPGEAQVSWFVKQLIHQIVDEEAIEFGKMLTEGVESGLIPETQPDGTNTLAEMLKWVRDTRDAAEQGTLARSVGRGNTKARRPSSAS
jgi:hypothetical protein